MGVSGGVGGGGGGATYVAGYLLREHEVVAFPGHGREVVGVPGSDTAEGRVPVTAARSAADFETLGGNGARESLQAARRGVQVGEDVAACFRLFWPGTSLGGFSLCAGLFHPLLVLLI